MKWGYYYYLGSEISVFYDSMVAKVIVHAPTRAEAVRRMAAVLARTVILGVTTNQKFLISIMNNPRFQGGTFDTNFIALEKDRLFPPRSIQQVQSSVIAATFFDWLVRRESRVHLRNIQPNWRNVKWRVPSRKYVINDADEVEIKFDYQGEPQIGRHRFVCGVDKAPTPEEAKKIAASLEEIKPNLDQEVVLFDADFGKPQVGRQGVQGCAGVLRLTIGKCHFKV